MPRGSKQGSRSAAIREVLTQSPKIKAKEVVDLLGAKGVKVNTGLVYMVKGSMRSKAGRRRRKAARVAKVTRVAGSGLAADPVALIKKVRELAGEVGGLKNLKELVVVLGG